MFPSQDRIALKKANKARKAIRFTAMLAIRGMAAVAPWLAASNRFLASLQQQKKRCTLMWHLYGSKCKFRQPNSQNNLSPTIIVFIIFKISGGPASRIISKVIFNIVNNFDTEINFCECKKHLWGLKTGMQIFSICWSYSEGNRINNLNQLIINLMLINNWLSLIIRCWWIIWSYSLPVN